MNITDKDIAVWKAALDAYYNGCGDDTANETAVKLIAQHREEAMEQVLRELKMRLAKP